MNVAPYMKRSPTLQACVACEGSTREANTVGLITKTKKQNALNRQRKIPYHPLISHPLISFSKLDFLHNNHAYHTDSGNHWQDFVEIFR